jgi:ribosomal protein S18 acetylase RimI-like enzyme
VSGPPIRIVEADAPTAELVAALGRLIPQLSATAPAPTAAIVAEIVGAPATRLLVARDDAVGIVGALTLVLARTPTAVRATIEDVVVDGEARGRGIGEALTRAAIRLAGEAGARSVDLTSRPEREAANRLYARMGFARRDTNLYRFTVRDPG